MKSARINHPDKYKIRKMSEEPAFFKNYLDSNPLFSNSELSALSFFTSSKFNPILAMNSLIHNSVYKISKYTYFIIAA